MPRSKVAEQTVVQLEQVERHVRQAQRLVMEGAPCHQILRETAAARNGAAEVRRALLLHAMETCLAQLEGCEEEDVPALFDEILQIFERK